MKLFLTALTLLIILNVASGQTQNDTIFNSRTTTPVTIDGQATEDCWANAEWHAIDQVWIPYNATMKEGDFQGRFKVAWDENYLYTLIEVVDDSLSDDHADPLSKWWEDDCLEIFVDENRSKGDHTLNCNAFAYHISLSYDAVDLNSNNKGVNYKNNIIVEMDTIAKNTYLWEVAIKNYDASFNINNPDDSFVKLEPNKKMGLTIAYCDNDETTGRENFIGSMKMISSQANDMYKNADHFGLMILVDDKNLTGIDYQHENFDVKIYPVPANKHLTIKTHTSNKKSITITTLSGQKLLSEYFSDSSYLLNIENLEAGIYLVNIKENNKSHTFKFIKQ